jgi:hypothetical protein
MVCPFVLITTHLYPNKFISYLSFTTYFMKLPHYEFAVFVEFAILVIC